MLNVMCSNGLRTVLTCSRERGGPDFTCGERAISLYGRPVHGALPEPDTVLTSYRLEGVVPIETVALLVEVSDSTLGTDLGRKADLYADAGVREYWVVDLNEDRVLCHVNPREDGSGYDGQLDVLFGTPLYAATVDGLTVETVLLD